MTPYIVLIVLGIYIALLFVIAHITSRGSDNATFFSARRQAPTGVVIVAAIGAAITGVTFTSVPGMVVTKGYSYLQMALGFIVGYLVIAYVLVPVFYRRRLITIYGYLGERYGLTTYRTGAWIFFIAKMLGAAVRFYVVCIVMQALVAGPLGIPFWASVTGWIVLIWLYTFRGGVKTVIWTDVLNTLCLIASVVICIICIARGLGYDLPALVRAVSDDPTSRMFYFDDPKAGTYFWKQFLSGIFMVIASTGLDQDLMQRNLAAKDTRSSQRSMVVTTLVQFVIIAFFLVLGTLLVQYQTGFLGREVPADTDELFAQVAWSDGMPLIVGILFILGLVSATFSATGSALTALTTSFTVDILQREKDTKVRQLVHVLMSVCMGVVIIVFQRMNNQEAISAVFTLASYTYGPILGLFTFGLLSRRQVRGHFVPFICLLSPALCYGIKQCLLLRFGYVMSFELLLLNAALTAFGLWLASSRRSGS